MILDNELNSKTISVNGTRLILQSQRIGVKHRLGGFAWSRPVAVVVEQAGETQRIPILDVTRIVTLFLWSLSLIFAVIQVWTFRKGREEI